MARSTSVLEKTADPHARCARARFLEAKGAEGRPSGAREPSVERLDGERSRRYSAPTRLDTSTRDSVELSDAFGITSQFRVPRTAPGLREARNRNYRYIPVPFGQNSFIVDRPVTRASFTKSLCN